MDTLKNDSERGQTENHSSDNIFETEDHSHDESEHGPNGTMPPGTVNEGRQLGGGMPNRRFRTGDEILGRYVVKEELGQGGMGVVYHCLDKVGNTDVAVKCLPPEVSHNPAEMEDVRDNYTLVTKLAHPNIAICKTLERDEDTGDYYLVMDYVDGESLRQWMRRQRRERKLSPEAALPILRQIAEALDAAHRQGVIHRDVKPDNVKISTDGTVKVLDFGLAAQIRSSMAHISNETVARAGTNLYKSPEQWLASTRQGEATDQYSLAVTAYEMLSGRVPFDSDDMSMLKDAVLTRMPEPIEGLPSHANAALMAALAKEPKDRYANCVDFVRALGGEKVKPCGGAPKQNSRLWLAAAVAVLLAVGAGYFAMNRKTEEPTDGPIPPVVENQKMDAVDVPPVVELPKTDTVDVPPVVEQPKTDTVDAKEKPEVAEKEASAPGEKVAEPIPNGGVKPPDVPAITLPEDYYIIKGELDAFSKEQFKSTWDRGGTFGENMDGFKQNYEAGVAAHNDKKHEMAYKYFKMAKEGKDWLVDNLQPRENALEARRAAETAKRNAEKRQPQIYARGKWGDAEKTLQEAVALYDQGNFKDAGSKFGDAKAAFDETAESALAAHVDTLVKRVSDFVKTNDPDDFRRANGVIDELEKLSPEKAKECRRTVEDAVRRRQVAELIKAAQAAKANGNWQAAFVNASDALTKDPGNQEAMRLRQEAENNLNPTARVVATVDGREVTAHLEVNGKRYETPIKYDPLEKGKILRGTLSYRRGDAEYKGEFNETVDWNGKKTITVALKKVEFNGIVTLPGGVKLEMVKIPSGEFTMGSPEGEQGRGSDETRHKVKLTKDFWLGKTEVTQAQYAAVMVDVTNERGERCSTRPSYFKGDDQLPVEQVSWYDAKAFCNKLNVLLKDKLPEGYRFDLPTEAQWEYAAHGGDRSGGYEKYSGGNNLDLLGWYYENSGNNRLDDNNWKYENLSSNKCSTHPVGLKRPNELGLRDMSGNVWEWCRDSCEWEGGVVTDTYKDGVVDPLCRTGSRRVDRGGSWFLQAALCRSANRDSFAPSDRGSSLGFRVALVSVQ